MQKHIAAIRAIGDVIRRLHREYGVPERCLVRLDLHDTNLQGVNLQSANLQSAYVQLANLQEASLQGANLQGVEELIQEQLAQARGDETTTLPEGLVPPASWTQGEDKQTDTKE